MLCVVATLVLGLPLSTRAAVLAASTADEANADITEQVAQSAFEDIEDEDEAISGDEADATLMRREEGSRRRRGGYSLVNPPESSRKYSSIWGNNAIGHGHARSMLDSPQAWSAAANDVKQWVSLDMGSKKAVRGVYFQSRKRSPWGNQMVTEAHFEYSKDCLDYTPVEENTGFRTNVVANSDGRYLVKWHTPVVARCIKVCVDLWEHHVSLRVALYARTPIGSDTAAEATEFLVVNPAENKRTYSSVWGNNAIGTGHARSMLDSVQAWSARWNNQDQWMTMDMGTKKTVQGVFFQARANIAYRCCDNQIVTGAHFEYSKDCKDYTPVDHSKIYPTGVVAYSDRKMLVHWSKPLVARCVKVLVDTYSAHESMRAALSARAPTATELSHEKLEFLVVNPAESSRSYSSIWGNNAIGTGHARSQLDSLQAWSARWNNKHQWMIIKLLNVQSLNGAYFQGRNKVSCCGNQIVTQVQFETSEDCKDYSAVDNNKVFSTGVQVNDNAKRFVKWSMEIMAKCVKVKVVSWSGHISMRVGLSGGPLQSNGEGTAEGYLQKASSEEHQDSGASLAPQAPAAQATDLFYGDGTPTHLAEDFKHEAYPHEFDFYPDGTPSYITEDVLPNSTVQNFDFYGDGTPTQKE